MRTQGRMTLAEHDAKRTHLLRPFLRTMTMSESSSSSTRSLSTSMRPSTGRSASESDSMARARRDEDGPALAEDGPPLMGRVETSRESLEAIAI